MIQRVTRIALPELELGSAPSTQWLCLDSRAPNAKRGIRRHLSTTSRTRSTSVRPTDNWTGAMLRGIQSLTRGCTAQQ